MKPRASTITDSDIAAYMVRNPLCVETKETIRALILTEYPNDLGFAKRNAPTCPASEPEATECDHECFDIKPLGRGSYLYHCSDCGETRTVFDEP